MGSRKVKAFADARTSRERRPEYEADRRRRRAFVRAHLHDHGEYAGHGVWSAVCEVCHLRKTLPLSDWWADHVHAVADGGSEHGRLRLSCKACQIVQGSRIANAHNPLATPRKRAPEPHPGATAPRAPAAPVRPRVARGQRR